MNNPTPTPAAQLGSRTPTDVTDSAGMKFSKAQAILELINENTCDADMNAINGSAWAVRDFLAEAETELFTLVEELVARLEACDRGIEPSPELNDAAPASFESHRRQMAEYISRTIEALESLDEAHAAPILEMVRELQRNVTAIGDPASTTF